mmetsp:Transcript_10011/g.29137  ORF Transcript_10011/g.29137 Transcript_10011/m.29137 type:complete len:87 (-) Transcript_10011:406-666(-)
MRPRNRRGLYGMRGMKTNAEIEVHSIQITKHRRMTTFLVGGTYLSNLFVRLSSRYNSIAMLALIHDDVPHAHITLKLCQKHAPCEK